jgi:succinate dehydrogenase flavin-adding protein (antitoxin of CptAB toxin-antitoxin module)
VDRVARDKLKWKCRRGLLELDLVLERFFRGNPSLAEAEADQLRVLLDLPDNDLWEIVSGRNEACDPLLRDIVERLRAA